MIWVKQTTIGSSWAVGDVVVIVVGELVVRNLVGAVVCDLIEGVVVG